jgi:sugar O-acyltransferase (sialic acid O-acetyltransferase NeuD family)
VSDAQRFPDAQFVNTIGSDQSFRRRPEIIAATGLARERFATLVHPGASVSPRATLGHGVYVCFGASIAGAVALGDHVAIGANATIGHDSRIGDHAIVAPGAVVSGFVTLGQGCYVGAASAIRQRVTIGSGALVGMSANVLHEVAAEEVVVGNPARPLAVASAR